MADAQRASSSPPEGPPSYYKFIGLGLAIGSAVITGSSFVFKKKGLIKANSTAEEDSPDGEDNHRYLKEGMWWFGMGLMALGEVMNFAAYAFAPAILVSPLGGISVVVSTVLSSYLLKEKLDAVGWIGCLECLLGATIVVIYAPETISTQTIPQFFSFFVYPSFLAYFIVVVLILVVLVFVVAPRKGRTNLLVYISITSLGGALLAVAAQGWGSSIVYTLNGHWSSDNQALYWEWYILGAFVIGTIIFQVNYLNKALNLFSTAVVTPVYFVTFTTMTIITSLILFLGGSSTSTSPVGVITTILGFGVIAGGVAQLYLFNWAAAARVHTRRARESISSSAQPQTPSPSAHGPEMVFIANHGGSAQQQLEGSEMPGTTDQLGSADSTKSKSDGLQDILSRHVSGGSNLFRGKDKEGTVSQSPSAREMDVAAEAS
ncbi:DUF803-domain-containing protein [Gonapodya prolifera JEL478]|uniref:DUF803-domain-containing protein n=1 Tax=Gonapodya prolifera (strain JEL478) TaxID=1344416 RepID=A0A139AXI3_GONPJ|nr:DUF803-domain-containing protein [Gonapodya prolifera JEL478]|eukprot:KXS21414.1 DUF803-domain-containing protein [Gonapodya prolifera JEL478]